MNFQSWMLIGGLVFLVFSAGMDILNFAFFRRRLEALCLKYVSGLPSDDIASADAVVTFVSYMPPDMCGKHVHKKLAALVSSRNKVAE
jgi:hypothetical protein